MIHLGLIGPVPPVQTGPADYLANILPGLARHAEVTVFVPDPSAVDPGLRSQYRFRPLAERWDPAIDLLIYHIANNPEQIPAIDAALEGPPGVLELHDGSQHHLVAYRYATSIEALKKYSRILTAAHGQAGARLGELRRTGPGLQSELFLYDALRPLLGRHRGVVVHNRWAADLVEMRSPGTPTWIVPHFAPKPLAATSRAAMGLPQDKLLIAHFGYVTLPKRPQLVLEAFAELRKTGVNAHLVFGGAADPGAKEMLADETAAHRLSKHVTLTGYLTRSQMDGLMSVVDIVVNLRFPHLGESSGVLAEAMAAGRAVIVHSIGGWADLPIGSVVRTPLGGGELQGLVEALVQLSDPEQRARVGRAAQAYAATVLDLDRCALALVAAAESAVARSTTPARDVISARRRAVEAVLATSPLASPLLKAVAPAHLGAKLLDIGGSDELRQALAGPWAYGVSAHDGDISPLGLPYSSGWFAVVTMAMPGNSAARDPMLPLTQANRVLAGGGLLVLHEEPWTAIGVDHSSLQRLLQLAGFSVEQEWDRVLSARKARLPSERFPDAFYRDRYLEVGRVA